MNTLCLDFGNTIKKYAVFENDSIKEMGIISNDSNDEILSVIQEHDPTRSILSSVIDHDPSLESILKESSEFILLNNKTPLPFSTPVPQPGTIGPDRLALCAAASILFPSSNNLIIALGSCITYNFLNNKSQFLGGSISPGLNMRFRAMNQFTAKLPLVQPEWQFPLVGYDTKTNLLSGVILGITVEIDGIINKYHQLYSNFNVLLTGGDTPYFARHLKNKIFADPQLIFKGLYAISEHNKTAKT